MGMYDSSYDSLILGMAGGALSGILMAAVLVTLAIAVIQIVAMWRIFTKAGEKGWKSLIPIYNLVVLYRISGISPWLILCYLASVIPIVGQILIFGLTIYAAYNLAKVFGKGAGFTVGLILLPSIFYMILGFGSAEYLGDN